MSGLIRTMKQLKLALKEIIKEALPPKGGQPLGGVGSKRTHGGWSKDMQGQEFDDIEIAKREVESLIYSAKTLLKTLDSGSVQAIQNKSQNFSYKKPQNVKDSLRKIDIHVESLHKLLDHEK